MEQQIDFEKIKGIEEVKRSIRTCALRLLYNNEDEKIVKAFLKFYHFDDSEFEKLKGIYEEWFDLERERTLIEAFKHLDYTDNWKKERLMVLRKQRKLLKKVA